VPSLIYPPLPCNENGPKRAWSDLREADFWTASHQPAVRHIAP